MDEMAGSSAPAKDPRAIARKYQLDLCKRAMEENTIVHLGTGGGKTHIAVLLMYELGHMIRKPSKDVCIFLAPTLPLVQQQGGYIESSTDFRVRNYYGNYKSLSHDSWNKEINETEVLVMTPQIFLDKLRHCYIRMELVALLIFDECHHAQLHKRHPYAQIMKEFYKTETGRRPRIFGMTASPIIGKGGSNQLNYAKCINSLECLLDAKVCFVDENVELESIVASPDVKVYFYGPVGVNGSDFNHTYCKKLKEIKSHCISMARENAADLRDFQRRIKLLMRVHANLIFCLEYIGFCGTVHAAHALLSGECFDVMAMDADDCKDNSLALLYLDHANSTFNRDPLIGCMSTGCDSYSLEGLEEPFFSKKLSLLIEILHEYRGRTNIKCIVFVKRIIVAKSLARILGNLKSLEFWKCEFLVGFHSRSVTRKGMNGIVEKFSSGEVNLLVATAVAEEGLDIQTCCLVVRFDLPETVASFIQSRGRARMQNSEYIVLLERGNEREERMLDNFMFGEKIMNDEISCRATSETFDNLEETTYRVETGASISTGCSVPLLHHYCSKLPHDEYFTPAPKFFFKEDLSGTICCICLPPNCPIRQVESLPLASKQAAKRAACLKACIELHALGALTEYLLPASRDQKPESREVLYESDCEEGEYLTMGKELHEKLVPAMLRAPQTDIEDQFNFHFYLIKFKPIPDDRKYREFGLFVTTPLPKEAETMDVDLCLTHRRIVKTGLIHSGSVMFDKEKIVSAQKFQEMFLKIIFDRSKFFSDFVSLGEVDILEKTSTYYLLLPVIPNVCHDKMSIDWTVVERCLSSPVFQSTGADRKDNAVSSLETLNLANGPVEKKDIINSLVFNSRNKFFFFVEDILYDTNAYSQMKGSQSSTYVEHYLNRFVRAQKEHFIELPPELCCLKIIGFSKDIGSSLSLLPSFMHRLESLLLAAQLKDVFSSSFPEGSEISAYHVLEALTTEKCLEGFSLERLEVLGDAFLKYAIARHGFLLYDAVDEGRLTKKRSTIVSNSHLYELAVMKNLQVYIHDEPFDPSHFFALRQHCQVVCNKDTESGLHSRMAESNAGTVKCNKRHRWLQRKTISDVVEALIGAFLVDSGLKAASAFLQWIGIRVDFDVLNIHRVCKESYKNMSLSDNIDIAALERLLGYTFQHKGLLLQAFIHPSYNKHLGGCYQRLEFLGDAVLDYLITSYLYSGYPDLKPGQLTDLKSMTVNNISFAHTAISLSLHKYLIQDSDGLMEAIEKFQTSVNSPVSAEGIINEPGCPKVLGDLVESCIGSVLLDSGFDLNCVWKTMMNLLHETLRFSSLQLNPVRELRELCQSRHLKLNFSHRVRVKGEYKVEVMVTAEEKTLTFTAVDRNSKVAKTMASREALSNLKALGFNRKGRSLKQIMQTTSKKNPELIGFDETPAVTSYAEMEDSSSISSSSSEDEALVASLPGPAQEPTSSHEVKGKAEEELSPMSVAPSGYTDGMTEALCKKNPRAKLFEVCARNYWRRPSFSCWKEEGESHLKTFAFKVIVEVEAASRTIIESFGDCKPRKKEAQDHAAEGALWCLGSMGFLP
ncbi:unnamed protein product [Spirodela intermedia]|uniref:Uncharacterized protein n=1 Tax=Spirodela intermedia TaxID=51605 RepID=A0A7I8KM11_SPIIN|nr:unnamed protein product [Spirodela intermedia]